MHLRRGAGQTLLGGSVAVWSDCTGLENRRRKTVRELESHRFRQFPNEDRAQIFQPSVDTEVAPQICTARWVETPGLMLD